MNGFVDTMTNGGWKAIANGAGMWMAVIPTVIALCAQAVVFIRQAIKAGPMVGLTKDDISTAMKAGTICTIGPRYVHVHCHGGLYEPDRRTVCVAESSIIGTITTEIWVPPPAPPPWAWSSEAPTMASSPSATLFGSLL